MLSLESGESALKDDRPTINWINHHILHDDSIGFRSFYPVDSNLFYYILCVNISVIKP